MHVVNGDGDVLTCENPCQNAGRRYRWLKIGPGETNYNIYDRQVVEETVNWLTANGNQEAVGAFCFNGSTTFPIDCPKRILEAYDHLDIMPTKPRDNPEHPWHRDARMSDYGQFYTRKDASLIGLLLWPCHIY